MLDMSSFTECKFSCTPKSKPTQTPKVKSAAINKSLLTPCRRIGLAKRSPSTVFETNKSCAEDKQFVMENIKKSDSNPERKTDHLYRHTPLSKRHKSTGRRFIVPSKGKHLDEINDFSKDHDAVEGDVRIFCESSDNYVVEHELEEKSDIEDICFLKENVTSYSDSENRTCHVYTPHKHFKSSAREFIGKRRGEDLDDVGYFTRDTDVNREKNTSIDLQESNDLAVNLKVGALNANVVSVPGKHSLGTNTMENPTSELSQIMPSQEGITKESLEALRLRVRRKQDEVEELKLAQLYKRKHDLKRLIDLTERWCKGCQEALRELCNVSEEKGCQLTIQQLLDKLGIPNNLVRYDNDLEDFV